MVSQILLYISDVRDNKFVDSQCHISITFEVEISFPTDFLGFTTILLGQIKIYTTLYSVVMVKDNIHVMSHMYHVIISPLMDQYSMAFTSGSDMTLILVWYLKIMNT